MGFGLTFASETARDSIYSSSESLVSVDNSMILSADLDNYNFNLRIVGITEDSKNYYAAYSYDTLAVENGVWQSKAIEKTLTVNKEALDGKDLGLYLAKELTDNINYELSYLKKVQKLERDKGESRKIVTVEYSGLIGKLLDPKEVVIDGYNPVIPEAAPEAPASDVELKPEQIVVSENQEESTNSNTPVNTQLVQEVVGQILQNNATSTPEVQATTTNTTTNTTTIENTELPATPPTAPVEPPQAPPAPEAPVPTPELAQ